jgi:hypothetical protein
VLTVLSMVPQARAHFADLLLHPSIDLILAK